MRLYGIAAMEPSPPDSNESNEGFNSSPKELPQHSQPSTYIQSDLEAQNSQINHAAQFQQSSPAPTTAGNRLTVPAACVACRTKHLKCDGAKPCSRCNSYGIECSYVRSRRGYKGPRRVPKQNTEQHGPTGE